MLQEKLFIGRGVKSLFHHTRDAAASDSRLTLDQTLPGQAQTVQLAVGQSDSSYKTFLVPGGIGVSTFGAASIGGEPLAGFVESFINEVAEPEKLDVEGTANAILNYFAAMNPVPAISFYVAGYKPGPTPEQQVWSVTLASKAVTRANPSGIPGLVWGGETDILARLIQPLAELDQNGQIAKPAPHYPIPWNFFTLQDAIDFATFALRATIDAIRFQPRAKTVGGPIDVLVITPTTSKWIQRKELHVS